MPSILRECFAVRPVTEADKEGGGRLKRVLTAWSLTAIGLGATIGTGVFVLTGQVAANQSGPAVTLSLLIAAFGSGLAALCYAELAAFLPVPGSAYSYTYATLGEAVAWFIGWNLLLEYGMSASAVAVSWSAYTVNLLESAGIHLPKVLVNAPLEAVNDHIVMTGALFNVPAALIVLAMSAVCYVGMRETAGLNTVMVLLKVAIIILFILAGLSYINTDFWHPYIPANTGQFGHFGWTGIMKGAAIIFFSYVGFDTASTTALEARNPQRDLPVGIIAALLISSVLYVATAAVMTGMVPYTQLGVDAPVAVALDAHPQLGAWLAVFVKIGAIVGMTSVVLGSLLGQPRILLAMADDGLLPPAIARCHPKYKTPHVATVVTGVIFAVIAGVFPLDILTDLISIGILLAFGVVCIGVLILRRTRPDAPRPFRVPWAPFTCVLGAVFCLFIAAFLSHGTWIRLILWTILGFAIYALYGFKHSRLRKR